MRGLLKVELLKRFVREVNMARPKYAPRSFLSVASSALHLLAKSLLEVLTVQVYLESGLILYVCMHFSKILSLPG